jgi:hypothetical protein
MSIKSIINLISFFKQHYHFTTEIWTATVGEAKIEGRIVIQKNIIPNAAIVCE